MDFHSTRAMGEVFATQPQFSHLNSPVRQNFTPSNQRATLHYLPQARKQVEPSWRRYEPDLSSSCRRDMDAVDEEIITRLCYALELDKLYVLPDLGLSADVVNRMWTKSLSLAQWTSLQNYITKEVPVYAIICRRDVRNLQEHYQELRQLGRDLEMFTRH